MVLVAFVLAPATFDLQSLVWRLLGEFNENTSLDHRDHLRDRLACRDRRSQPDLLAARLYVSTKALLLSSTVGNKVG